MTQCPVCYVPLRLVVVSGIDIDVCDICHAIWLDAGELEKLGDTRRLESREFAASELSLLRCPRCATRSFGMIETDRGSFAICTKCRGVLVGGKTVEELSAGTNRTGDRIANAALEAPHVLSFLGDLMWLFGSP